MIPGIHVSTSGGLDRALHTLVELGLSAGQIFSSNQRQWNGRPVKPEERESFAEFSDFKILSHASYLINLASTRSGIAEKSSKALSEELHRMSLLGIRWLVMHPGAHLGSGEVKAISRVARMIREVLAEAPEQTGVLFETTAGQGTSLGHSFGQLKCILDETGFSARTGICFDTCHSFAAGYDISSIDGVNRTFDEFQSMIDLNRIKAFHINDSLRELGSRRDRHSRLGEGRIGLESLRYLTLLEVFKDIPGIVETPGSDADRARDALLVMGNNRD